MSANQKTITTNGLEVLVVEVPDNTYKCDVSGRILAVFRNHEVYQDSDMYRLPEGNWKGKLFQEMSEEECCKLVEISNPELISMFAYNIYDNVSGLTLSSRKSFASLLRFNGFNPDTQKLFIAVKEK